MTSLINKHVPTFARLFRFAPAKPAAQAPAAPKERRVRASTNASKWKAMFDQLAAFKAQNGHCDVPGNVPQHRPLFNWVYAQRYARHIGVLTSSRLSALTELGLKWGPGVGQARERQTKWRQKLAQVVEFKQQHGHVAIPSNQPKLVSLRGWVDSQRRAARLGTLPASRLKELREVGIAA